MLSRTSLRLVHSVCSRSICSTSQFHRKKKSHDAFLTDLISEKGLVQEKVQGRKKRPKQFNEKDYAATKENCYGSINIKVEGYDMVTVEKFSEVIHRFVLQKKIKVRETYALPTDFTTVKHIDDRMTADIKQMNSEAELPVHTRVVQISDLSATFAPILIQSLLQDVPPAVTLTFETYTGEEYLKRRKENQELKAAQEQYDELRKMR